MLNLVSNLNAKVKKHIVHAELPKAVQLFFVPSQELECKADLTGYARLLVVAHQDCKTRIWSR